MSTPQNGRTLPQLWDIMQKLLSPEGCPWDRQQTPETLRNYLLEEAHEVVEAIDGGQPEDLREELGDLLFQIVFLAAIGEQRSWFGLDDVISGIASKLERRHPHVFGTETPANLDAIATRWEEIKRQEKGDRPLLAGIPAHLPVLLKAHKVGQRAARVGLDLGDVSEARAKVFEEVGEIDQALQQGDVAAAERELGDALFSLVNWARLSGLDPEAGLRGAVGRFVARIEHVEAAAQSNGTAVTALDRAALDALWEAAKNAEK